MTAVQHFKRFTDENLVFETITLYNSINQTQSNMISLFELTVHEIADERSSAKQAIRSIKELECLQGKQVEKFIDLLEAHVAACEKELDKADTH